MSKRTSLNGGDSLARGSHSATFPSSSHVAQMDWDLSFMDEKEFRKKYKLTHKEYLKLVSK